MFNNLRRVRVATRSTVSKLMNCIKKYGLEVVYLKRNDRLTMQEAKKQHGNKSLMDLIYIKETDTNLEITTRWLENKPTTYVFNLNEAQSSTKTGHACFAEFSRYFKVPKEIDNPDFEQYMNADSGKFGPSARPIVGYNKTYNNGEYYDCYEYDLNSAYSSVLLKKVPDLNKRLGWGIVKENQIGFLLDDELTMMKPGKHADVRFNLIDTPKGLRDFIYKYYTIKQNSTGYEKINAKAMLNLPIGYCQRYNPFLRAYVVHSCNEVIKQLINNDTLFWNTDAIFSLKRRQELELGTEIGQFKEIKCKRIRYRGNNYQIDDEIPTFRGTPKAWFKAYEKKYNKKYNLLTDKTPPRENYWLWDWDNLKLRRNSTWQEEN